VATLDEALELRAGGVDGPILVLYPIPVARVDTAARAWLTLSVTSERSARELADAADRIPSRQRVGVHLEVETGLTRDGVRPDRAAGIARLIDSTPHLALEGVWSHLASPEDGAATTRQVELFDASIDAIRDTGVDVPFRHLAATGGVLTGQAQGYEAVRPGLAIYGVVPAGLDVDVGAATDLRPAMRLVARAVRIEEVPAGTAVSYGGRWVAQRPSRIATLPVGYGDGFVRAYGDRRGAIVRGRRAPIVGVVAMDATMVDVTDIGGVSEDDEFVLLGRQGDEEITAGELAETRSTIAWEVLSSMARRLPRVYHAATRAVRVRTLEEDRPA
jgi:alanine racemase